jgi:hypothetical protein
MPAQGHQDHTPLSSASHRTSDDALRPSHPASNTRDDREAPLLSEAGRRESKHDFRFSESEIFVAARPDGAMRLMRLAKFACPRTCQRTLLATANAASGARSIKLICPTGRSVCRS